MKKLWAIVYLNGKAVHKDIEKAQKSLIPPNRGPSISSLPSNVSTTQSTLSTATSNHTSQTNITTSNLSSDNSFLQLDGPAEDFPTLHNTPKIYVNEFLIKSLLHK